MIPVFRQVLVALSSQLAALSVGGSVVYPTQLLQQLKTNDSTIHLDLNTSSWIGSIYGLAGIPVVFLPIFMQWKGRKLAQIITCSFLVVGWGLALIANSTTLFLLSEAFQGLGTNSLIPVSCLSITEMLAPKYRFVSMQFFGVTMAIGMMVVGILGRFLHTRTICLIMLIPSILAITITLIWPESPSWYAYKGEFDKCERAFVRLRGVDEASKQELEDLLVAQKEHFINSKSKTNLQEFRKQITSRDFYMPGFHMFVLMLMLYGSGGDVILIYFLELIERTSQSKDTVKIGGIVLYSIIFFSCAITTITVRYFKNKTVLLSSTLGVIVSLISASIVTYLQSIEILAKDSSLCMYCLIGFMVCNGLGLNALVFYISAELMPVRHRNIGGALYIIINCGLYALTLKTSPYLIEYVGMSATFLIFTTNAIICAIFVWANIPETKGKTLQELEDFYVYGKFVKRNVQETSALNVRPRGKSSFDNV